MVAGQSTLAALLADVHRCPQVLLNVHIAPGFDWRGHAAIAAATREVEAQLLGHGRLLLRASGTEPLLRVMVEADDSALAAACAAQLADVIEAAVAA